MTERMAKARLLHCKKAARQIYEGILHSGEIKYSQFDDSDMSELRLRTEKLLQYVHELNTYRNVVNNSKG